VKASERREVAFGREKEERMPKAEDETRSELGLVIRVGAAGMDR
jgi:hypothetical protein